MHGSDAHRLEKVLKPEKNRFCWIRAALNFVGLKQTLLEPEARVSIGENAPSGPAEIECIESVNITNAPWLNEKKIELNKGLVAIIGPKGSGKTALADIIAVAAKTSIDDQASFLLKATEYLGEAQAELQWADGSTTPPHLLSETESNSPSLVRYLSQQFVERLCSAKGMDGELLHEIKTVIFQSIAEEDRLWASGFDELEKLKLQELRDSKQDLIEQIQNFANQIAAEDEKKEKLPKLIDHQKELSKNIEKSDKELKALLPKDKKKEIEQLNALEIVCANKEKIFADFNLQQTKLDQLNNAFARLKQSCEKEFEDLKEKYFQCGLQESDWNKLRPVVSENISVITENVKAQIKRNIDKLSKGDPDNPKDPEVFASWSLNELKEREKSLIAEIGLEKTRAKQHGELLKNNTKLKSDLERINKEIENATQSDVRKKKAIEQRRQAYADIFDLYLREQEVLEQLYAPLKVRLASGDSGANRLSFHVHRLVNLESWVSKGEDLLDLRKQGSFQGKGGLALVAQEKLLLAWRTGNATVVAAAMEDFVAENMKGLIASRADHVTLQDMGRWLFSIDHVNLSYGIRYDGVDISKLSPGMRGIVLLILYLSVDQWDMRPLIVDQPEENLDPQSVYDELVRYFRDAKNRRQIILVTHNPNLVVNADADQVIVAEAKREGEGLPKICYISGGLEDPRIRDAVCRILEGGERAFREREQRYAFPSNPRTSSINAPTSTTA